MLSSFEKNSEKAAPFLEHPINVSIDFFQIFIGARRLPDLLNLDPELDFIQDSLPELCSVDCRTVSIEK
jgi:hypothetical protein